MKTTVLLFDFFGTLVEYVSDRNLIEYLSSHSFLLENLSAEGAAFYGRGDIGYEEYCNAWSNAFLAFESERNEGREFLMRDVARRCCDLLGIALTDPSNDNMTDQLVGAYMADWSKSVRLMTGAHGLLTRLSKHYRLGLISNTHHAETVYRLLETFGLRSLFEVVILSAEWGYPKPHVSIFDATLKRMSISAGDAVYIGNSFDADYRGGQNIGMPCYLVGRHARVPRDRQLRNIQDLAIYFDTSA